MSDSNCACCGMQHGMEGHGDRVCSDLARLRADNERLTKERDEAREEKEQIVMRQDPDWQMLESKVLRLEAALREIANVTGLAPLQATTGDMLQIAMACARAALSGEAP